MVLTGINKQKITKRGLNQSERYVPRARSAHTTDSLTTVLFHICYITHPSLFFPNQPQEIEWRRQANLEANNGKERKDLYTDNWDGDVYKGSKFNVLTVILLASVLAPLAGLIFAYQTYGVLWG